MRNFMGPSILMIVLFYTSLGWSAEDPNIKDNSFLIEEAYNQEAGVIQFIQGYQYSDLTKEWVYTFTNEFPVPDETDQFSYVLPMVKKTGINGNPDEKGLGDVVLNYRYQAVNTEKIAMAPRISLILPTGDYKKGLGNGATGIQVNQTLSVIVSPQFSHHWNAGWTYTPNAQNSAGEKASLVGFNFGMSGIYNLTQKTNFLCEFAFNNNETVVTTNQKSSVSSYLIVPGIRSAFKARNDTEIVPGLAAILGFGPSAVDHERGVFIYFSVESKLW